MFTYGTLNAMKTLQFTLVCYYFTHFVTSQAIMVIESPHNQSVCEGGTVEFTCVIMFPSGTTPGGAIWTTDGADASQLPGHTVTNDASSAPANVTTVLTVTNVNISNNGTGYVCRLFRIGGNAVASNTSFLTVLTIPSSPPQDISVTPLSSTAFMVTWNISDPNYIYTVMWTNLKTSEMNNFTVQDSEINSYTVTGLSDDANYNVSVIAENMCGNNTSTPITVYDPPNQPSFDQCVSYDNGQPTLSVLSYVDVITIPNKSLSLTFSASYQTGNTGNSNSQSATCSLLSDMQYSCTAEFAVDVIPSVDTIESVNVTVSGPYGDNSTMRTTDLVAPAIINVMSLTTATLDCTLPCFSPRINCSLSSIAPNNSEMMITYGEIMGSSTSYSYPTQQIMISNLANDTRYDYCVVAIDIINNMEVGDPVCGNFTITSGTIPTTGDSISDDGEDNTGLIVGVIVGVILILIIICIGIYCYHKNKKASNDGDRQGLKSPTTSTMEGHDKPSNVNVPHQTADSGVEYAVTTKAVSIPQRQQQPPAQEYALVDKSKKKNSAANQGIMYADLQDLPSGAPPPANQGPTSTYAMVA